MADKQSSAFLIFYIQIYNSGLVTQDAVYGKCVI